MLQSDSIRPKQLPFIDEVQEIKDFEKAILSLQSDESCQIMVTGSNAKMLSSELSTRLRGRYMGYHIHGLDYDEFIEFHNLQDSDESLSLFCSMVVCHSFANSDLKTPT